MTAQTPTSAVEALRTAEIERVRCQTRAGVLMRDCGMDAEVQRDVIDAVMEALAASQGDAAPAGDAVAWLHTIQQGGGEHDQALSFAPDNFPLGDELGFRSLGAVPLFTQPPSDAEPFGWYLAEDWLGWKKGYTFRARPTGGATTTAPFIPLYVAPTEAAAVGLEMAAWSERLSRPHDNRTVRRLLLEWAKRLTTAQPQATPPTPAADGKGGAVDAEDAARWRALIGTGRVRYLGSAGLHTDSDPYGNPWNGYAHIGVELWTKHEATSDPEAVRLLTLYADKAVALAARTKEST